MTFEKVEVDMWKPEKSKDEIIGVLLEKETDVGENNSTLYHLEVDGKSIGVWGSAVLNTKMAPVQVGSKIKIVYLGTGEAQKGRNPPKLFDVYVDKDYPKESETFQG